MNIGANNTGALKNKYKIPVTWKMQGHVEVMAENLDDAWEIASTSQLPSEGQYVCGSFTVDSQSPYEVENFRLRYEVENEISYTENIDFPRGLGRMFTR